jgi:2',3'-cyclic-nucleotide 2'-phosphodiesterase/3'-nucleotidase
MLPAASGLDAPLTYDIDIAQVEIRQLIIDWVTANKTTDASTFATVAWKLVSNGQPVTVNA